MIIRLLLVFVLLPLTAWAQDLPALHDVTGVASDDRLNVRATPAASGARIGDLPPDAAGVEVTARTGGWGRINLGETAGWVSMRYLAPQTPQDDTALPTHLSCFGTEPFWSLDLSEGNTVLFQTPDGADDPVRSASVQRDAARAGHLILGFGPSTAIIQPDPACSDGMSDRLFGLAVDLIKRDPATSAHYVGCCSIAP
ncbi:MAG: SH3 domain-containing protein [Marinibacterium sp.]|nr:SH3 domain-containing protein [Marinibacterium sp.]